MRLSVDAAGLLAAGPGPGRGAYVCPHAACVERAVRGDALARRLRTPVVVREDLAERIAGLLPGERKPLG